MGQPGKVQTTLLTPVDVMKADWLSKGNKDPEILAIKPPKPKIVQTKDMPEYIVDPVTKTTYLKGTFLGKGGFARAYELTDLTTNQVYAGKIVSKSNITKSHHMEKIFQEIAVHRQLQHKNVVRFHHFFKDEHNVYIILENCSKKSLDHVLSNRKTLTEPEVRYFMKQLAEGVQYTHSKGIIHRDLKLGNLFLTEEMEMKLGDFGLATCSKKNSTGAEKVEHKSSVCGTPNYIAPEVLNMQGHSFASDVWAMGCIMYAMLIGHPPFESASLNETYHRISSNKYSLPSSLSEPARNLISKMLHLKPSERPSLEEILNHDFFTSGHMPSSLAASCCFSIPKFPSGSLSKRSSSEQNLRLAAKVVDLHLSPKPDVPKIQIKSEDSSPKKDNCFPTNFRQKLTNVLCPDKIVCKKPKELFSSVLMLSLVQNALDSMPKDCDSNPAPLAHNLRPFITKWINYSNKYGFSFQLSDRTIGVLFNDSARMNISANRTHIEFVDANGKVTTYSHNNVPSSLGHYFTLVKYFSKFMDENLSEGGELQTEDLVRKKTTYLKRWAQSDDAVAMQLSTGITQINFSKDHTKIVISAEGSVMYIDQDRKRETYSLAALSKHGCKPEIRSCLRYAASVLEYFAQIDEESS